MSQEQILKANLNCFFRLNGKVYQILAIYGNCFQCFQIENCTSKDHGDYFRLIGEECLISARMVLGTIELTRFID